MDNMPSRRDLLACAAASLPSIAAVRSPFPVVDGVPRVDYHAHPSQNLSPEQCIAISQKLGVKFGLLQHAGDPQYNRYWGLIRNDDDLNAWIKSMAGKPIFIGIQAEYTNWMSCFSKAALGRLDYVLTDALTMPGEGNRPIHIWTREFQCDNAEQWMDRYTDYHVQILSTQPIHIIANPTYLPDQLLPGYDKLWTQKRMRAIIDAAVKRRIAIEINSRFEVPRLPFLQMARDAGLKFSFGSNIHTPDRIGNIDYCVSMFRRLGLTLNHFWQPRPRT
jgi:histidinol phosphatase-like PHP family hydrolase